MRILLFLYFLIFAVTGIEAYGQGFLVNSCDSSLLTKDELEKCRADTAWSADIVIAVNYITRIKTDLLPQYRKRRKELELSNELKSSLRPLKAIYDSVLRAKLLRVLDDMDRNQKRVQPKAYLSSLMWWQTFILYPDVYAILLNDIHLRLAPTTSSYELSIYKELVDRNLKAIPPDLFKQLEQITASFISDREKCRKDGFSPLFQGTQSVEDRKNYEIINFLLWDN